MRRSLLAIGIPLLLIGAGCHIEKTPDTGDERSPYAYPTGVPGAQIAAPEITAENQSITEGRIVLGPVTMPITGWLVAYSNDGEKPGKVIGHGYLYADTYPEVNIAIDDTSYTGKVYLVVHEDAGAYVEFEFPGVDMPLMIDGTVPTTSFIIE